MSEHPILFSGPMIRAILDGRKTQTRRLMRIPPGILRASGASVDALVERMRGALARQQPGIAWFDDGRPEARWTCPYPPGSLAWIKEQLRGDGQPGNRRIGIVRYGADGELASDRRGLFASDVLWSWTRPVLPAMFCPRWASRITLRIKSVRIERVQAISDADIAAEGVTPAAVRALWEGATRRQRDAADICELGRIDLHPPHEWWRVGWTLLHGRESWDADPFVWVIGFRRAP